jgi:nitrogen regulatory protein PII-like uncharacterized protein
LEVAVFLGFFPEMENLKKAKNVLADQGGRGYIAALPGAHNTVSRPHHRKE